MKTFKEQLDDLKKQQGKEFDAEGYVIKIASLEIQAIVKEIENLGLNKIKLQKGLVFPEFLSSCLLAVASHVAIHLNRLADRGILNKQTVESFKKQTFAKFSELFFLKDVTPENVKKVGIHVQEFKSNEVDNLKDKIKKELNNETSN